jgi:2-polyprenyl-3-methyl-5-hydroxy-6-metoxy-1,4-benzoquinol methylase
MQSIPRKATSDVKRPPRVSAGADFGDVRYGKGFRDRHAWCMIQGHVDAFKPGLRVLDIGSSRGHFMRLMREVLTDPMVVGVEPDRSLISESDPPVICSYFENVKFDGKFDLIHCTHTLEHVVSPYVVVAKILQLLENGGVAYFEVPNINIIHQHDIVEEIFIDKHLYHFDLSTFLQYLGSFERLSFGKDEENLYAVCRKKSLYNTRVSIADYIVRLELNKKVLAAIANDLNDGSWIIWGAGRIHAALIDNGLDPSITTVDEFLPGGRRPDTLTSMPEKVFVASRVYASDIILHARELWPDCEIITFGEYFR